VIPGSGESLKPIKLYYRNPIDAVQSLLDRPSLADHLEYIPRKLWTKSDDEEERIYNEILTGDWAWETQVGTILNCPPIISMIA
jgi:Plavaka transposase